MEMVTAIEMKYADRLDYGDTSQIVIIEMDW